MMTYESVSFFIDKELSHMQNKVPTTLKYWINEHACLFKSSVLIYNWVYSKAKQLN